MSYANFREELRKLINSEGVDAAVGCPDDVLADYLFGCLANFRAAIAMNTPERPWYPATTPPRSQTLQALLKALEAGSYNA